jgi:NADPH2:quinone reductase
VIEECIERVASGELPMFIDRSFALSEAAAAHAYIEGRSAFGRVVMRPKG